MSAAACRAALLLHGAGGGGWEWRHWQPVLAAAGIEVAAPDLQPAAAGLEATTLADYRAQALAALQALPRPRVVIGASLGGLLAVQVAAVADALVLVNPLPPNPWASRLPARASYPPRIRWSQTADLASTRRALADADAASCRFAASHWRDEAGGVLNEARAGVDVVAPACPTLVLASGQDSDVPPALSRALAEAWRAELIELPAASHVGPLLGRQAEASAGQVRDWLQQRPPRWG